MTAPIINIPLDTFAITSRGAVQGTVKPNLSTGAKLSQGGYTLADPLDIMWAGTAVSPLLTDGSAPVSNSIAKATAMANLGGFTVSELDGRSHMQMYGGNAPFHNSTGFVNFYAVGSGARVWLHIDTAFAATLVPAKSTYVKASFDFVQQKFVTPAADATFFTFENIILSGCLGIDFDVPSRQVNWNGNSALVCVVI